ncbi:MAG TPA: response regulator [Ktedonosporobacter sp.]|jgi:chemotaxis protein histidine kinase CheA/ActR/RegA family two-component response regulator|nr:response regulator [Ktedonosporobacter sp.]
MNETSFPSDENELTAEDMAVLQAFDAMEHWNNELSPAATAAAQPETPLPGSRNYDVSSEEMHLLFAGEVEEDIARMRRVLNQMEQEDHIDPARFATLQRLAHKLRGTAGAVECHGMAAIAHDIELITEQISRSQLFPLLGVNALARAVSALEQSLASFVRTGREDEAILVEFEAQLKSLNLDPQQLEMQQEQRASSEAVHPPIDEDTAPHHVPTQLSPDLTAPPSPPSSTPLIRVDARRIDRLVLHSEQMEEQRAPLESAQAQVEIALSELHTAQARLRQLEPLLFKLFNNEKPRNLLESSPSSLIARILNEASPRGDNYAVRRLKNRARFARGERTTDPTRWDELDMERYSEKDTLIRSLNEAIADVTIASSRVQAAFTSLHVVQQEYMSRAALVHSDALVLRLAPLSALIPRLQRAITMSAMAQQRQVQFEVTGEETEIDQSILEALTSPLLQLLRTCITDTFSAQEGEAIPQSSRIWLNANGIGNEITIEIGFSMAVQGGALEMIREPIQRLNGTFALQRNPSGGMSFFFRFPRSQGAARCLLVRSGNQYLLVPFSQVQQVKDGRQYQCDILYNLADLLGFARQSGRSQGQPVLVMSRSTAHRMVGMAVDEVVDEVELVVKPLKNYLQRPGISGAAIDGKGNVLLMLDLPELIRYYTLLRRQTPASPGLSHDQEPRSAQPKILVADDSVSLRQSLLQTLRQADFSVAEARDGMEALEQLLEESIPDVFLLDIEMPNLNGYDLLNIMRLYPELASVKIIMLTSRSSEKHMQRAFELGADAYLIKPCPHDKLLATIQEMLARR